MTLHITVHVYEWQLSPESPFHSPLVSRPDTTLPSFIACPSRGRGINYFFNKSSNYSCAHYAKYKPYCHDLISRRPEFDPCQMSAGCCVKALILLNTEYNSLQRPSITRQAHHTSTRGLSTPLTWGRKLFLLCQVGSWKFVWNVCVEWQWTTDRVCSP